MRLVLLALASCVDPGELAESTPRPRETVNLAASGRAAVDILAVVDDSCVRPVYQARVASQMSRLTAALDADAPDADVRFGVVTTSLGTADVATSLVCRDNHGALQNNHCAGLTDSYLVHGVNLWTGARVTNYTGSLDEALECLMNVPVLGCGVEQPLEAMRIALSTPGFLRPEADLVVLLVTNEDDTSVSNPHYFDHLLDDPGGGDFSRFRYGVICDPDAPDTLGRKTGCRSREDSPYLHPIGEYVDFLRSLKPDPARITIAGIYGDPSPVEVVAGPALVATCRDPDGDRTADGEPAVRLADLVSAFGDRAVTSSVCGRDYPALDALGELALRSATRRGCFARPIADTSSVAPGLQPDCEVDVTLDGFDPVPVPACRAGTSALALCWRIAIDPTACPDGEHDRLELAGPGPNPAHLRIRATCDVAD